MDEYKKETGEYFNKDKGKFGQAHEDAYDSNSIISLKDATDLMLQEI